MYSILNVNSNDILGGLLTFFVIFIYGYTVLLCLFDAIMRKSLCDNECFVLRYLFSYQTEMLALASHLVFQIFFYLFVNYMVLNIWYQLG